MQFASTMTSLSTQIKDDLILNQIKLKIVEPTTIRSFPNNFKNIFDTSIFSETANKDVWDKINISLEDYNLKFIVQFENIEFDAKMTNLFANIKHRKDGTMFTEYTLVFYKELDNSIDTKLSTFLKYKTENEDGKKEIVFFDTTLKTIEE